MTTLDVTDEVVDKAIEYGCQLIVSHHPLIFHPLTSLDEADSHSKLVLRLVESKISVISLHTRFDAADGGLNDCLAERLGAERCEKFGIEEDGCLLGRCFAVDTTASEFALLAAKRLGCPVRLYGDEKARIKKVGVVSGGGKSYLYSAKAAGCDLFLTGDLTHSAVIDASEKGLVLIDAGHFATEVICCEIFKNVLMSLDPSLEIINFSPDFSGKIIY